MFVLFKIKNDERVRNVDYSKGCFNDFCDLAELLNLIFCVRFIVCDLFICVDFFQPIQVVPEQTADELSAPFSTTPVLTVPTTPALTIHATPEFN